MKYRSVVVAFLAALFLSACSQVGVVKDLRPVAMKKVAEVIDEVVDASENIVCDDLPVIVARSRYGRTKETWAAWLMFCDSRRFMAGRSM